MGEARWVLLREAWQRALYGDGGFYLRERPGDHFRTSAHVGPAFAGAIAELARRLGASTVCDVGAGAGELLTHLAALVHSAGPAHSAEPAPDLALSGVELRPRPPALPRSVGWGSAAPRSQAGLLVANELLDNIACDVVVRAADGLRLVEFDLDSGAERAGPVAGQAEARWVETWWPLAALGERAEVGLAREAAWAALRRANPGAWLLAVDFGHVRADRPAGGSLSSYRAGRQRPVRFDGRQDVAAAVAFDALAAAVPGRLRRQRDVLRELGVRGDRPDLSRATTDPAGYLRALAAAGEAAELTAGGGLGDFYWLLSPPLDDRQSTA